MRQQRKGIKACDFKNSLAFKSKTALAISYEGRIQRLKFSKDSFFNFWTPVMSPREQVSREHVRPRKTQLDREVLQDSQY